MQAGNRVAKRPATISGKMQSMRELVATGLRIIVGLLLLATTRRAVDHAVHSVFEEIVR
jgi:hypothetical protein